MLRYVWRDLLHNPRRTLASLVGVTLGVGLFSGILFFMDGSGATLTERAIAPLPLDMQLVLTSAPGGGLRLSEQLSAPAALGAGEMATVTLTVTNGGAAAANEVVLSDLPPSPLVYVTGTTNMDGAAIPDISGQSPLSHGLAGFGLNIGKVEPGASATISYGVRAEQAVADVGSLPLTGSVSSREQVVPTPANGPPVLTLEELQKKLASIPGVAAADGLGFVDLPPGSLTVSGSSVRDPVRVFAFDLNYQAHYPSIQIVAGGLRAGSALLSAEAARTLEAEPGAIVGLSVPGRATPLSLRVGGVVDLAHAQPLFSSRKSSKLEEFLYVPDSVVVTPETFRDEIIPAFQRALSSFGTVSKSFPALEVDVLVDRAGLQADPGTALKQTGRIAAAIDGVGSQQAYLIDNISNTLAVARDDAATGRRMFLFLGLPGLLMAAFLAAYAGSILAAAQRREQANLRVRGADRGHLRRIALYKALAFSGAGSVLGIALGLISAAGILGWARFLEAAPGDLAGSGLIAFGAGALITAIALYVPAHRSVGREVSEERREMHVARAPAWRRLRLDLALLAVAGIAEVVALRTGAPPAPGSVYEGLAISLPSRLLIAPLIAWLGGVFLCVRLLLSIASRLPGPSSSAFGSVIRGILSRSLRRRSWALANGIIGLGLVVGFGMSLTIFTATYDAAKVADARFIVGSDLRITPSALSARAHLQSYLSELTVPGVSAVTPVVFRLENSVLVGPYNQHRKNLAALDPATFARIAPLPDSLFVEGPGAAALAALETDPRGVLVDAETADDLQVEVGDPVKVILALGTKRETQVRFRVAALFERFPGFPEGANLVVDLGRYEESTGLRHIDFFLAAVTDHTHAGLARAVATLRSGPGTNQPIHIDSTETALDKDQTSLTAVNVNGLVSLDSLYMVLMSAAAIAMFIFGQMLQRRREYVSLRAQGLRMHELHALVLGEAALVAICGLAAGLLVGSGVALLLVHVLRALFILEPAVTFPVGRIVMLAAQVLAATLVSGLAATEILRRLRPTEILREE